MLAFLDKARAAADVSASSPSVVVAQVERKGIASVTDAEWRKHFVAQVKQQAEDGYRLALTQASVTVAELYTPEEKLGYAELLDARQPNRPMEEVATTWIPAAAAAELKDREAAWRGNVLLHGSAELAAAQLTAFDSLEDQRMDNANHARTLEQYAVLAKPAQRVQVLLEAEGAWRADGNHAGELQVLKAIRALGDAPQTDERYFELLLQTNPDALVREDTDVSANFVLAHTGSAKMDALAYRAIDARAKQNKPVWGSAMTALTGLFFADASPRIDGAFHHALGDMTISERLKRSDPTSEIVGKEWFAYGMRYGVYRGLSGAEAEDYLAAGLEGAPDSAASYVTLAHAYEDAKKVDAALAEYDHALEVTNDSASIHIEKAELLWNANRHPQAVDEWKAALVDLRRLVDTRAVPESFWIEFAGVARDLRERALGVQFKPELEAVLRPYIVKNGNYRSDELLHSALTAVSRPGAADAAAGEERLVADEASAAWIAGLAEAAAEPGGLLAELCNGSWFPRAWLGPVYKRRLQLAEAEFVSRQATNGGDGVDYEADQIRSNYLAFLIKQRAFAESDALYESTSKKSRGQADLPRLMILLRGLEGRASELVSSFSSDPGGVPDLQTIASAADALRREHGTETEGSRDKDGARVLLEYVFAQKLAASELAAPDYLALAQSRLESPAASPDVAGALEVLRRMTMLPGDMYENLDSIAGLLLRSGHRVEAVAFLKLLADANPWKPEYRVRLAEVRMLLGQGGNADYEALTSVAANGDASYGLRTDAATALRKVPGQHSFGSSELTLLASHSVTPAQADKPYFVRARELAAAGAPVADRPEILRAAMGFAPGDGLRLAVFKAEVEAGADERALAAVTPLLKDTRGYSGRYSDRDSEGRLPADGKTLEDQTADPGPQAEASEDADQAPVVMVPAIVPSRMEKLAFSLDVAKVHERLGQDDEAEPWLVEAMRLTGSGNEKADRTTTTAGGGQLRAQLVKRLGAVRERVRVRVENSARRPVVQSSIGQAVLVRPRVSGGAMGGQP